ncbi:class I SAM-dependent methyltransferase [Streptomyces sp. CRN 30]|uniref:class I SAM-dependent methyltransferase n=1 Tax=Streptomyces sp. CRN 30 TaxID=3075613 RepID=UPI002A80A4D7|nr:class I SAM-dependent methyltransferase [Streptomyces sp. CRN 30]
MADAAERVPDAGVLAEEIFDGLRAAMEVFAVDVGVRRGLYEALASHGSMTARELSRTAGVHARYAREWLEQQAVAGVLAVSGPPSGDDVYERRFALPAEHARVLVDRDDPLFLGTGPQFVVSIAGVLPELLEAFGTGAGVPYERYGRGTREGIAGLNRPLYRPETVRSWVAALPDVHGRLAGGPGGRVLDLGCGLGWSTIALARAFPAARLTGIDLDDASVEQARRNAREAGLGERVSFVRTDAAGVRGGGSVDLVTVFEALHDMADPVGALVSVRRLLSPSGAVLVADEKVSEEFTAPGPELDRVNYAFSVLHCLPATRAEGARVEAGTVLRPDMVRGYARGAGYGTVEVLDIEHDLWRFYRISP